MGCQNVVSWSREEGKGWNNRVKDIDWNERRTESVFGGGRGGRSRQQ